MKPIVSDRSDVEAIVSFDKMVECLPHGSGIDCKWGFEEMRDGACYLTNSFHMMDEHGYYDGWAPFKVFIHYSKKYSLYRLEGPLEGKYQPWEKPNDIKVKIFFDTPDSSARRKVEKLDLRNYLEDVVIEGVRKAIPEAEPTHPAITAEEVMQLMFANIPEGKPLIIK